MTKIDKARHADASVESCPVAALADEARGLVDAYSAVDAARTSEAEKSEHERRLERSVKVTHEFIYGVVDRATFLRAASAKGALFQICAINNFLDDLETLADPALRDVRTPEDREKSHEIGKKIGRLLYSVAGYIEDVSGARLQDACGDYWMEPKYSPFVSIDEAFKLHATKAKTA